MSGSMNTVILIGNVGVEPEVKILKNGSPVAKFSLATSERWRGKDGEAHERTEWHRVVIFNEGLCRIVEQYVHKGTKLALQGQIQTRSWEDQSGAKRYSTEIVLQGFNATLTLLGGPGDAAREAPQSAEIEDEIPF